jgi:hypothetical protein
MSGRASNRADSGILRKLFWENEKLKLDARREE